MIPKIIQISVGGTQEDVHIYGLGEDGKLYGWVSKKMDGPTPEEPARKFRWIYGWVLEKDEINE